jgi:hypothetical protein
MAAQFVFPDPSAALHRAGTSARATQTAETCCRQMQPINPAFDRNSHQQLGFPFAPAVPNLSKRGAKWQPLTKK